MEIGGLQFKASPWKNLSNPYSINKLDVVVHAYNPSYLGGRGRKIVIKDSLGKSTRCYLKTK
jgi:hypothetical protein